jgi:hypothetical protein
MNILTGVFNFESLLAIIIMGIFILLTISSLFRAKTTQEREHYFIAIGIEVLLLYLIIYTMKNFSSKTKKFIGFLDIFDIIT